LSKPNSDKDFGKRNPQIKVRRLLILYQPLKKKDFCKIKAYVKYRNYLTLLLPAEAIYWFCFALPMWKIKLVWMS